MKFIFILLFLYSCSQVQIVSKEKTKQSKDNSFKYTTESIHVKNGKIKYVEFPVDVNDGTYSLHCEEQGTDKPLIADYPFVVEGKIGFFYYAESYFSSAKKHICTFKQHEVLEVIVTQFPYKEEKLNVAKGKVVLSKKNLARVLKEQKMTKELYSKSAPTLYINQPFVKPLNSYITSHYGNRRLFNNKKKTQHLGNDLRAAVGVPIPVTNRGKVVFAGNLFYTGNVVIIDHGLNIFSLYGHLSKIKAQVGDIVNQGDIVGLAGMTGRVSGPHLHWGIKINGHNVDGFSLVTESKKQFSEN